MPRGGQKRLSKLGEHNLMGSTIEQSYTELELQLPNLGADVRLNDRQPLAGSRETSCVGDRDDVTKLVQLHALGSGEEYQWKC
jgi:hypothetical protein